MAETVPLYIPVPHAFAWISATELSREADRRGESLKRDVFRKRSDRGSNAGPQA